jgi:hypothetical protein
LTRSAPGGTRRRSSDWSPAWAPPLTHPATRCRCPPSRRAAAPLFVAGHPVKGGQFYGDEPSLTALDPNGNLQYNVDFRSVYATVLERIIGTDPAPILGGQFSPIPFV